MKKKQRETVSLTKVKEGGSGRQEREREEKREREREEREKSLRERRRNVEEDRLWCRMWRSEYGIRQPGTDVVQPVSARARFTESSSSLSTSRTLDKQNPPSLRITAVTR